MYHFICKINKLLVCLCLWVFSNSLIAQEYKAELQWLPNKKELINGFEQWVLNFTDANYLSSERGLPALLLTPSFEKITLGKTIYKSLTVEELNIVDTTLIGTTPTIHALKGIMYKKPMVNTYIVPFRKNTISGKIEKLVSFTYTGKNEPVTLKRSLREAASSYGTTKSVLAEGDWYKLSIAGAANATGSGIYKMDYNFLQSIGFPVASIDPRKIKLYGNGGGMLPMANSTSRPDDLMENAIYISGESDGKFDPADYILFYAKGPHEWKYDYDKDFKKYNHIKNIYSETSSYFITSSETDGLRVSTKANAYNGGVEVTTFPDYVFYESDEFNLLESGQKWYSKAIDSPLNFRFNTEGIVPNSSVAVKTSLMAQARLQTNFTININGEIFNQTISSYPFTSPYGARAIQKTEVNSVVSDNSNLNIGISYNKGGNASSRGFLDYVEALFTRKIALYGNQTNFRINGIDAPEIKKIKIATSNPNATNVWDVTIPYNCSAPTTAIENNALVFSDSIFSLKEFIVFTGSSFAAPGFAGKVANQNLHALDAGGLPDMVIITREDFLQQANRLKSFRKQHDNFDVEIVTTNQIYNEFSSGAQDLTALRDFLKLLYKRGTSSDSVRYVLLLGATSYDCKNRIPNNINVVPVFESTESLDNVNSYSSEDYIVLLDDIEGAWEINPASPNSLDMGIGRLPARNEAEAQNLIGKIIDYHTNIQSFGKWRNRISFVADDADYAGSQSEHVINSERAAASLTSNDNQLNLEKFYLNAYPQIASPGGEVSPAIKQAFLRNINRGTLLANFTGHGSEFIWTQEDIFNIDDINNLKNKYLLPFFVTATCEFGRYDDPNKFSGAQSLILNPDGGAIGLLCSTRPVYGESNTQMNIAFFKALLPASSKQRKYPTMGEVMMGAKNNKNAQININNRNYTLLCDPSLTLSFPKDEVVIKKINNKPLDENNNDTLKALSVVTIQGEIQKNQLLQKDFTGTISLSLFDKVNKMTTIVTPSNAAMTYELRNNVVYDGTVSVDSGMFIFKFILPKDINYEIGSAKLSFYAQSKDGRDAGNAYTDIQIGGSNDIIAADNTPPRIRLFMDDSTFVSGGLTNTNTHLVAKLYDENGINISSSSIGHEITGRLNNGKEVVVMNEFYTAENNSYQHGQVIYPFANLEPGTYNLTFKAWDTYNNSSSSNIEFIVSESEKLALKDVMNFPNPFTDKTNFGFDHNRAGETLLVKIEITDNMGRLVKTLTKTIANSETHVKDIEWEGDDNVGSKMAAGSYVYKITVTAEKDKANTFEVHRLVMLN